MKSNISAKIELFASMSIFGTIGIFRRYIPYSSTFIAMSRGLIGTVFIYFILLLRKDHIDFSEVKKRLLLLILSGAAIGFNWVLLFEAYRYTSVSVATACYYMAPVFTVIGAAFIFRDRLTVKKTLCIIISCVGMILVSDIFKTGVSGIKGCLFGLIAAVAYSCVVLMNRSITGINAFHRTIIQLAVSAVVVGIYAVFTEDFSALTFSWKPFILLLIVGILHTGTAYTMYFSSMTRLPTQTVALFSYIDPVLSILLSALILHESLTFTVIIGIIMVLGGTVISEIALTKSEK